jgi:putative MATE family efflux protein
MEQVTENKMGTQPVGKLIAAMSLPAMFSMLIQALYNIVDSFFVAKINQNALTAVSYAFPIQMLLIAVAVGTGIGLNSLVSRRLGEGRREEASRAATHGIFLAVFSWLLFAALGLFFTRAFFAAYTNVQEIIDMGTQYLGIVCIFSFGIFVEVNLEKTLQATGNMIFPMLFQLVGAVANIVLDPLFIFTFKMGVAGAAVATVAGQILSMIFALLVVFFKEHEVKITLRGFRFHAKTIRDIYAVGFPSIIMQSIGSVLILGLNWILGWFSEAAVTVLGVYYKLQSFVFMPVFGLTHGVMPIMGYNFGAQQKKRLLDTLRIGLIVAVVIMSLGTVLFWLLPEQLLQIFNASKEMLDIGEPALRTISLCFIPAALGIMFSTIFQAVGKGSYSLIISILRQLVVILPVAYLMAKTGVLNNVWYAFPIAEVVSFIASVVLYQYLYKHCLKRLGHKEDVMPDKLEVLDS